MATSFTPITIVSSTSYSTNRNHRKKSSVSVSAAVNWWTPLFGWSSDPDYIHTPTIIAIEGSVTETSDPNKVKTYKSRFTPGCFTEEKAKQLRMKTLETNNFHEIMYHSAIASRLASDDVSGHYRQ